MSQAQTPAKHRAEAQSRARSPQDLEHDIEQTRDRLADTLDELLFRIKPKTIAQRQIEGTKSHFVDAQGNLRTERVVAVAGAVVGVLTFFVVVRRLTS